MSNNPLRYIDPTGHMEVADGSVQDRFRRSVHDRYRSPRPWRGERDGRDNNSTDGGGKQLIANALSVGATVLDLVSLGISTSGSFTELHHGAVGATGGGGLPGFVAGFVEGVAEYNVNPLLNPAENLLGWASFGMVFASDWIAGNSKIHTNQDNVTELVIGQDSLVSFTAAYTGSASEIGEALSDTGINATIVGYDVLRLTNKIPTMVELRVNAHGIFLMNP